MSSSGNTIEIPDETKMYYFDYEEIIQTLFEYLASENPWIDFQATCSYWSDDDCLDESFSIKYSDGIMIETKDGKELKIIFCEPDSIGEYTMPTTVKEIKQKAFLNCAEMTKIEVSPKVKQIGNQTFKGCLKLEKIVLPKSVTKIAVSAFSDCPNLKIITPAGSFAETYAKKHNIPFINDK